MANTPAPRQSQRPSASGIAILVLGLILFVLIFFLEYTYSMKRGDLLGSILYAFPLSGLLTGSSLLFLASRTQERQAHIPWHRQTAMLAGLLALSLSLLPLLQLINSLLNNGVPDAVGIPIAVVVFLLEVCIVVRLAMIYRSRTGRST